MNLHSSWVENGEVLAYVGDTHEGKGSGAQRTLFVLTAWWSDDAFDYLVVSSVGLLEVARLGRSRRSAPR